tara:strand:- start:3201 stop:3545 length:345 start_codon:yes stop_codon:yes gene_type:complete
MASFSSKLIKLIDAMIITNSKSLKDFNDGKDDDDFLKFQGIDTLEKKKIINKILKDAYELNPYTGSHKRLNSIKSNFKKNTIKQKRRRITRSMTTTTASANKKKTKKKKRKKLR